ncbi:MAG: GntR family transcriptional regulator [Novosphingobium sp.]
MALVDENLHSPRYVQVYTALKAWINQGAYPPGGRLPSEPELCDIFGVSRITVRAAVEMLENQGCVERKQGRGTFVSTVPTETPSRGDFSELVRRLRQLDQRSSLQDVHIRRIPADDATARDLHLPVGAEVLQASFVRVRDSQPIGYTTLTISGQLGIELTPDDLVIGPAPTLLQGKGFEILGAHQLISATLADTQLASVLKTTVGAPLVHVRLQLLDLASQPIELLSAYYRADSYVHHVFLAAAPARGGRPEGRPPA